ncbi:hypothetical protein HDU67_000722 [Dinochytrium kinnereticum]|nr:hypothetical protein HDU67_000722 [Dinochytrium kinnereticum]
MVTDPPILKLVEEIGKLRETIQRMEAHLAAKDQEIAHLRAAIASTAPEAGEAIPTPQDARKMLILDVIAALKESGLLPVQPPPHPDPTDKPAARPTFVHPDPDPRHQGPTSYASAVRSIASRSATANAACRVVFRSTFPRRTVERIDNVYFKGSTGGSSLKGQRYVVIREALRSIGISSGVLDMSFIGGSVVHLLVDSAHTATITTALRKKGVLLPEFNPLSVPAHLAQDDHAAQARLEADASKKCVDRLAILLRRSGPVKRDAVLRGIPEEIAHAALAKSNQASNMRHEDAVFGPSQATQRTIVDTEADNIMDE